MNFFFASLGPEIKLFISISAIAGPVLILALIFILKKIEKKDPTRIRWK